MEVFTLANANGIEARITNYGGIVQALRVPDRNGRLDDVVLGFDAIESYLGPHPYFGGMIGRFANRIACGRFEMDGREYVLAENDRGNHLHGGLRGFDRVVWSAEASVIRGEMSLKLRHTSEDGNEGYPGNLACEVIYTLTDANALRIEYAATTDRPTIVNLTHHSYFNLAAGQATDILGHTLLVEAEAFLPVTSDLIPTGETPPVEGTAFDFRSPKAIGERRPADDPQLGMGHGYDHCFILNTANAPNTLRRAAKVSDPLSGRAMEVWTTEPGLQLYTGGSLDGTITGKEGRPYGPNAGLCLETQHFPDAPNQPAFPSVRLDPGSTYRSTTEYVFSTEP